MADLQLKRQPSPSSVAQKLHPQLSSLPSRPMWKKSLISNLCHTHMFINTYSNSIIVYYPTITPSTSYSTYDTALCTFPIDNSARRQQSSEFHPGGGTHMVFLTASYGCSSFIFSQRGGVLVLCRSTYHLAFDSLAPPPFTCHTPEMPSDLPPREGTTGLTSLALDDGQGLLIAMDYHQPGTLFVIPYA